jgi:hypothetical protein
MPAPGGEAATTPYRHGMEVKDEGHHKDLNVIFVFIEVFYNVRCFF